MLLLSMVSFGQGIQLGIRAGVNNGNLTTEIPNISEGKVQNGLLVGAFGRASLLGFFVQPEINFSQRVGAFEQVGVGSYTNTINTLDIVALVGYSLVGVIRLNAGPTLMTFLGTSQEATPTMKDNLYANDFYYNTAWGVQAGVGFDLGKLCVDLRYDTNLTSLGRDAVYSSVFGHNTNYTTGFGMVTFTLGYKIIKI